MKHCANCGSREILIGEAGAPSKCRVCDCHVFVEAKATTLATVTVRGEEELRVIPHASVSPERARQLFKFIHLVVEHAR